MVDFVRIKLTAFLNIQQIFEQTIFLSATTAGGRRTDWCGLANYSVLRAPPVNVARLPRFLKLVACCKYRLKYPKYGNIPKVFFRGAARLPTAIFVYFRFY